MGKVFTVWMLLLATMFVSCSNEDNGNRDGGFDTPQLSGVTATTVTVSCRIRWNESALAGATVGFAYRIKTQETGTFRRVDATSLSGGVATARLNGLHPATDYAVYCVVQWGNEGVLQSETITLTTLPGGENTPVINITSDQTIAATAVAATHTITFEITNPTSGSALAANSNAAWVHAFDYTVDGEVSFEIDANTGDARTAQVELTYPAAEAVTVTVQQESGKGEPKPVFTTLSHSAVTKTEATLSCKFAYAGTKTVSEAGFNYTAGSGGEKKSTTSTTVGDKTTNLSGLTAGTTYSYYFYAVVGGQTYKSEVGSFTTQDNTPSGGNTYRSGWAELPALKEMANDYYYAYHLCPDVSVGGGHKARNYSVCYSKELKCAIYVAAPMHTMYSKKNTNRTDAYTDDPDIPFDQPGKWSGYTRGHMLGSGERLVSKATNKQVFYHSNIAPQIQTYFNTGGGAWNTLEDWVDTQWTQNSDTTYQVIGCYWKDKNKKVSGTTIPTHFYKVLLRTKKHQNKWVTNCTRDELQCIAVMVEHRAYAKAEVPKTSQYEAKGMLYSVKDMEKMTGLTFFANVPNAPKDTYNVADWGL
ncbi:MAG: DNA/RNA non-specific endonuclease [Alistipes sp.]